MRSLGDLGFLVGDAEWYEGFRLGELILGLIDLSKEMPFGR